MTKNIVLILGIDTFLKKNMHQVNALTDKFKFEVLAAQPPHASLKETPALSLSVLPSSAVPRLFFLFKRLLKARKNCHHAEIYPGGRFSFIYLLLCKLMGIPTIVVERGDLITLNYVGWSIKQAMFLCYKYADIIWYREYYMKPQLEKISKKPLVFIANAVPLPKEPLKKEAPSKTTFLWANRIIPERKSDWLCDCLETPTFQSTPTTVIGLKEAIGGAVETLQTQLKNCKNPSLTLKPFGDPTPHYLSSKFFILPADIVFANYALLEAMSYGLVPIVSDVYGTDQLVINDTNGLTFPHTKDGLESALKKALALSKEDYEALSKNAKETIQTRYSIPIYKKKLNALYDQIGSLT